MNNDLTKGSILKTMIQFAIPYLISCFLQSFYGLADLFIIGQFEGKDAITAVSVGSQVMHMVTVIIVGLAMGTTVVISRAKGGHEDHLIQKAIGNSFILFASVSMLMTAILLACMSGILKALSVPIEALIGTRQYLTICFLGIVFITAYNVICSIFRGMGNTRIPLVFVAIAGIINILLDYLFIGAFHLSSMGAAIATVSSQAISVIIALLYFVSSARKGTTALKLQKSSLCPDYSLLKNLCKIGLPIATQDGLIQIAFLVITVIANMRGVEVAAAVGIVEKLISFMFLVPSAMLSSVSTITAANLGANRPERGQKTLYQGILICIISGSIFTVISLLFAEHILGLFVHDDPTVIVLGSQYLRSYVFDCIIAGVHFCFSGYFCAYEKSYLSFLHNMASVIIVRIPGAYFASKWYPDTLLPMGMAAPLGSLFSALICLVAYFILLKKSKKQV